MRSHLSSALLLLALGTLHAGCRSTDVAPTPEVPPDATTVVVTDNEMPRVLYAEAWGAFARFGWDVEDANPAALQFTTRPEGYTAAIHLYVEEDVEGGRVGTGRLVARVDEGQPGARDVLLGAARALATIPGRISFR